MSITPVDPSTQGEPAKRQKPKGAAPNGHAADDDVGKQPVGDIFDNLDAIRLDQNYGSGLRLRRPFTSCPIRKPRAHEWFRVSRDLVFETTLFEHKEELSAEWYLAVGHNVQAELEGKYLRRVCIYTWINRKGALHIWPVKLPDREGRSNDWDTSSAEACRVAQEHWAMLENTGGGWQAVIAEDENTPEPDWPPHTMNEVLRVAFKGGRVVDDLDHPLLHRLRGRNL
jgi:hypothetical protein